MVKKWNYRNSHAFNIWKVRELKINKLKTILYKVKSNSMSTFWNQFLTYMWVCVTVCAYVWFKNGVCQKMVELPIKRLIKFFKNI